MVFGMHNAPSTFLLCCDAYLDDLVVHSSSWEEYVEHLSQVFSRLKEAALTVNLEKFEFAQATVTYLGKVVGEVRFALCTPRLRAF